MKKKAWFELKIYCSRHFVGRKHCRKFERVCGSFLELEIVVTKWALRFWNGSRGRATKNSGLKHQGSSFESSRIDPLWTKATRFDPLLNKDRVLRFQKLKTVRSTHKNVRCPTQAWYNCLFLLCIIIYVHFCHDFMQ